MLVPLGLPDWALRFIIVLVIAGFFIAIAVAWGVGTEGPTGRRASGRTPIESTSAAASRRRIPTRRSRCSRLPT